MEEKSVKWTCPHCNNLHYYYWDEDDIFEGECNMICSSCRNQSKQMMYVNPVSGNAWCESIEKTNINVCTLMELIENWIDEATKFNEKTYHPEYYMGWDDCRRIIKSKLK